MTSAPGHLAAGAEPVRTGHWKHWLWRIPLQLALLSLLLVLPWRWIDPPLTALMAERQTSAWLEQQPLDIQHSWRPWTELPDSLKLAVLAAEDQKFPQHHGFDTGAILAAFRHNSAGGALRGASTISQQVAKNMFLWSGRSWLRKGLEAWFTLLLESCWSKQRILEIYLNSAEWDRGIFGAQAAARHYFGADASHLTLQQASLLAAILPDPVGRDAAHPAPQGRARASWIRQQIRQLGGARYLDRLDD